MFGYNGKLLRVNLTEKRSSVEEIPEKIARDYIGGRGFVARYLWDEIRPGTDPLSPENKIVIATGPLSGVFLPSSGKIEFGTKSPHTGGYADSNMGGHLSSELKLAGYDMVIIEGKSEKPVFLFIDDDRVEIRDASAYWGMGALSSEKKLKEDLGEEFQIAVIGPAGERGVTFSCISHDFGRQAGRAGVACVMGAKGLKAMAVRGTKTVPVAEPGKLLEKSRSMYRAIYEIPAFHTWTPYGTADITSFINENGAFPTKNFSRGFFEKAGEITGQKLREKIHVKDKGCFGCPIPCGKYSRVTYKGDTRYVEGPEYETIALVGGNCLIGDIAEIGYINYWMDEYGVDTISGGNVIGFALECIEKGIIPAEAVEGRELKFGDPDSVLYLLEKIVRKEGIGEILSQGVRKAAEILGKGSERFAIHVKGLEVSGYEPRNAAGMLLAYMTSDIGAHHGRAWAITYDIAVGRYEVKGKAEKVIDLQHIRPVIDMLTVCRFPWIELGFPLEEYEEVFKFVTGLDWGWKEFKKVGERVYNLTRAFNIREIKGFGRKDDYPPKRFYEEPLEGEGPTAGQHVSLEVLDAMLDDYYSLRGWTKDGRPTKEKLEELDLGFVSRELESI